MDKDKLIEIGMRAVEIESSLTGAGLGEYRIFRGKECLGEINSKRLLDAIAAALRSHAPK